MISGPLSAWRQGGVGSGLLQEVCVLVGAIHTLRFLISLIVFLDEIHTLGCYPGRAPHAISWRPRWRNRTIAQQTTLSTITVDRRITLRIFSPSRGKPKYRRCTLRKYDNTKPGEFSGGIGERMKT